MAEHGSLGSCRRATRVEQDARQVRILLWCWLGRHVSHLRDELISFNGVHSFAECGRFSFVDDVGARVCLNLSAELRSPESIVQGDKRNPRSCGTKKSHRVGEVVAS